MILSLVAALIVFFFFSQKGDIIDVLQMNPSGLWQGIAHGKAGLFKFINVELLSDKTLKRLKHPKHHRRGKPKSVEELLKRISMEVSE